MEELEGDEEFDYEYPEPDPNENKLMEDTAKRDELLAKGQDIAKDFQNATIAWIAACTVNDQSAVATAQEKRAELIEQMKNHYWEIDPYVRARSIYDRDGIIQPGGKIDYYPKSGKKVNGTAEAKTSATTTATAIGDADGDVKVIE